MPPFPLDTAGRIMKWNTRYPIWHVVRIDRTPMTTFIDSSRSDGPKTAAAKDGSRPIAAIQQSFVKGKSGNDALDYAPCQSKLMPLQTMQWRVKRPTSLSGAAQWTQLSLGSECLISDMASILSRPSELLIVLTTSRSIFLFFEVATSMRTIRLSSSNGIDHSLEQFSHSYVGIRNRNSVEER